MDNKKIKLALTVDLMNHSNQSNLIDKIKEVMSRFKEVGHFLGQQITRKRALSDSHESRSYAIRYENCIVNIDLISDDQNAQQIVQGFQVQ